jgi:Golgi SNAP receptor complex protein 1
MAGTTWDQLRRESRQLENEIDVKLVSFSKLASTYSRKERNGSDIDPASGGSDQVHLFDTMVMEVEQLLEKLRAVNIKMNDYMSSVNSVATPSTLYHTLQRHNDILQDYSQEFSRTKANIQAIQQREELLGGMRKDGSYNGGVNRRTDLYLKENEHLRNSERVVDDAISIAMATKENLTGQRTMFTGIATRMQTIAQTFPLINSLVHRINFRRRRDALIIGGVVAVCVVILLVIIFH